MSEPKTECRTPTKGRDGVTRIPTWKYDLVRAAILEAVGDNGILFKDLKSTLENLISKGDQEKLGSLSWHMTTVKLNMETEGELIRTQLKGLQFIKLKQ